MIGFYSNDRFGLKLLNGGHLLALLHKNGKDAHINIEEAKRINEDQKLEE